ncbi:MAG: cyclase family protein [bacterium]
MIAEIKHNGQTFRVDFSKPLDISIPLNSPKNKVTAWHVAPTRVEPVTMGDWTGSVKAGASVNFNNIFFNPHGNGTHTECLGHITPEAQSVNRQLTHFLFIAEVISIQPEMKGEDSIISADQVEAALQGKHPEAVVIRTLPNGLDKLNRNYSGTNPTYLSEAAAHLFRKKGIDHLLIDLPSVDREDDGGKLLAHKAFWDLSNTPRLQATITELVYVRDNIADGTYLLDLQTAPFENDATPSRPVLYSMT